MESLWYSCAGEFGQCRAHASCASMLGAGRGARDAIEAQPRLRLGELLRQLALESQHLVLCTRETKGHEGAKDVSAARAHEHAPDAHGSSRMGVRRWNATAWARLAVRTKQR
eukprot:4763643-Pleurochrysis_carterae.AAC.3